MSESYRIYRLDRARLVVDVEWVSAANDEEALAAAQAMTTMGLREIWLGRRLVGTIDATAADEEPSAACWL
ncbi:MAG TPA: hypothetical protein VFP57_08835 [Sphingomicrobium sp.]|nr:hypothetical protein [Sphingomicrobium sp.]